MKEFGRSVRALIRFSLVTGAASAAPALAEEEAALVEPPPEATLPANVEGAKSYAAADFTRFAPRTALDMLRQVPGFTIQEQDQRRGLGQASGNVLINGRRFSGKSNSVVTELSRISASDVVRVDIVDGATLDVPGLSGQVANMIVKTSGGISGNFAWRPQYRPELDQTQLTNGSVSMSGRAAGFDYTLSLANESFVGGDSGLEEVFTPVGEIIDLRDEVVTFRNEVPKLSLGLKREWGRTIANLNASTRLDHWNLQEISLRSGPGQVDRDRRLKERRREWGYELGGDVEFPVGQGSLKLVGLRRFEHSPFSQTLTVDFADPSPTAGDRFVQIADEAESILRGEYRWKGGGADWQISAEGALNILDVQNGIFRLVEEDFVELSLANAAARVSEKRAEGTISYGRRLSPTLSLQTSLGAEYSELRQSGPSGLTRTFVRPKGLMSLAWKPSPRLDISAKIERAVGQLNFYDFVASANVSAGTTNAGNPNLVPPQSWDGEIEATRNLGPWGTVTARLYGRLITDIVDFVPVGTGQSPGNLDKATLYGLQWTSTFNLDPLGWEGAKLDLDLQFQKHRLDDPVTGIRRSINETMQRRLVANFRHDIDGTPWAWGAGFENFLQSSGYRLDQAFRFVNTPGNLGLFVEHKNVLGLTVRGSVDNLLDTNVRFDRSFYDRRRTNPILFTESRDRFFGPLFTLSVSGKI